MTSQATFDAILNNLEDGLVIHDSTLRVVHLNQKALDILGVTVEQLKGGAAERQNTDGPTMEDGPGGWQPLSA